MQTHHLTPQDITGLVLAGGRGTRMGSVDKGLQTFNGQPLVLHAAERLRPQVGQLAINANRNRATYEAFGFPVWSDRIEGFPGPLAGLHTALVHSTTPWVVTVPCDSPFLPLDLVARLAQAAEHAQASIAVAVTGDEAPYQRQPVFCLVQTSLVASLEAFLAAGGRKVNQWFDAHACVEVHFDDEDAFRNFNTLDDLRQSETR